MIKQFLAFLLLAIKLSAFTQIISPEWSFTLDSKPTHFILYDSESDRLAEIAVAKTPNQVMLLSNTGDSILWAYQSRSLLNRLAVLERQGLNPILIVEAERDIVALDNMGKTIWQLHISDFKNKSKNWIETGNIDQNPGDEIVAFNEKSVYIISALGKVIRKFTLPFSPKQIEIGNIDNDIYEELVISDFKKIMVFESDGSINIELNLGVLNHQINTGFDLYDINLDHIEEIVTITQDVLESNERKIETRVSCFAGDKILWQTKESAGIPRAVRTVRGETYTAGTILSGTDYISKRDRAGKIIKTVYYSNIEPPQILISPNAKFPDNPISFQEIFSFGNLIMIGMGWFSELKLLHITKLGLFSSTLDRIDLTSPEYFSDSRLIISDRNQRLLDFQIGSINGDTLADIILSREQVDGKYSIDCLVNRYDLSYRLEDELWENFRAALGSGNQNQAVRLRRQAKIIASGLGDTITAVLIENSIRREWRRRLEGAAVRSILIAFLIVSVLGGFGVIVLRPLIKKRISRKSQLEVKSVPSVVKIATDVIALDHNYVVKGNLWGAYNRLNEIIEKYGLQADNDLKLVFQKSITLESAPSNEITQDDFRIPYYRFVRRMVKDSRTVNLISNIKKICSNILGSSNPITELALNRKEYALEKVIGRPVPVNAGLSVSFIYLVNRDFPDIYNTAKFFWSSRLYNWFEHICTDHLRYAKNYAHFIFDYETATEWSRKLVLHLVSDSDKSINYNHKESHLLAEVDELKTDFQDYILVSDDERVLYYPGEKIWVKIIDLLSILSTIISQSKIT